MNPAGEPIDPVVEYRLKTLETDVNAIGPLTLKVAEMAVEMKNMSTKLDNAVKRQDEKDTQDERDKKSIRNVLIALTGSILAAIVTAAGAIIAAGGHP